MKIEICLREVMQDYDINVYGNQGELANYLQTDRGTVRRLMNNKVHKVSLERLGAVCDWLLNVVDPKDRRKLRRELPSTLFRFSGLWDSLLQSKRITTVLSEKHLIASEEGEQRHAPIRRWVSSSDVHTWRFIEHQLSRDKPRGPLGFELVPFYFPDDPGRHSIDTEKRTEGIKTSQDSLEQLRADDGARLVLGSQRANLMVELMIAEYYECVPFRADPERRVPFYLRFREKDPDIMDSCFGGRDAGLQVGIHYRDANKRWACIDSIRNKQAAGVVTVKIDDRKNIEIVLFGFSGDCTQALGELFCTRPSAFWPREERRLAAYACRIPLAEASDEQKDAGPSIIPL